MDASEFEIGSYYNVTHTRKGTFTMFVESVDGGLVHGTVIDPLLSSIQLDAGKPVSVVIANHTFELVPQGE